ncbi:MAG TPA: hypothetical protein VGB48_05180 [Allosphingosinicella sp.]|jgi:hypothetical protein
MVLKRFAPAAAAAMFVLFGAPAAAQEAAPAETSVTVPTVEAPCCAVAALTPIEIEIGEDLSSKSSKARDSFKFTLAEPLMRGEQMLAPAGTPGVGEVVHAAKAGIGGKGGELILAARYLEIGDTKVPLRSLKYGRSQGKDSSGTVGIASSVAAAVVPVASVVGFMISGGEVRIPQGTRATAKVAAETVLPPVK